MGIAKKLVEKKVTPKCPMCGEKGFSMADAYTQRLLQPTLGTYKLTGLNVPTIMTFCKHCGFVSEHALGALGVDI